LLKTRAVWLKFMYQDFAIYAPGPTVPRHLQIRSFQTTMSWVFTPDNINLNINDIYNHEAAYSTSFALFCIFVIVRYSSRTMNSDYRFHLLNITVFTLICDLTITVLTRFYPLDPANGACFIGVLRRLTKWMDGDVVARMIVVSCFWFHLVEYLGIWEQILIEWKNLTYKSVVSER
jgi:hypothetical protein